MENTKHTPAPWNCEPSKTSDLSYHVFDDNGDYLTDGDLQHEANARLIAAAPELLACLEDFLECGPNAGHNQQLLINCRAVVEKARGTK